MNMKAISQHILVEQDIAPQQINTGNSVNGGGVDCSGYENLMAAVSVGVVDTGNITVILQESDDDGVADAYAAITDATTGAIAAAGENEMYLIDANLSEHKRWVRARATAAGGGFALVGVNLELHGRRLPPTQENTVVRV
jgi:hypothetical protein